MTENQGTTRGSGRGKVVLHFTSPALSKHGYEPSCRPYLDPDSPDVPNGHCGGVLVHDPHQWEGDRGPRSCVGTIPSPGGSR